MSTQQNDNETTTEHVETTVVVGDNDYLLRCIRRGEQQSIRDVKLALRAAGVRVSLMGGALAVGVFWDFLQAFFDLRCYLSGVYCGGL